MANIDWMWPKSKWPSLGGTVWVLSSPIGALDVTNIKWTLHCIAQLWTSSELPTGALAVASIEWTLHCGALVWPTSKWPSLGGPLSEFGTLQLELWLWPTSNGYTTAELCIVVNIKVAFVGGHCSEFGALQKGVLAVANIERTQSNVAIGGGTV